MPSVGFEPKISADEWPQTHTLDLAGTGTGPTQWGGGLFIVGISGRGVKV